MFYSFEYMRIFEKIGKPAQYTFYIIIYQKTNVKGNGFFGHDEIFLDSLTNKRCLLYKQQKKKRQRILKILCLF